MLLYWWSTPASSERTPSAYFNRMGDDREVQGHSGSSRCPVQHHTAVRDPGVKAGVDPQLVANNLGHKDTVMIMKVYGKYRPKTEDVARIQAALGPHFGPHLPEADAKSSRRKSRK